MPKNYNFQTRLLHKIFLFLGISLLSSCGWRVSRSLDSDQPTLSIPYVSGDSTGTLTAAIVEEVTKESGFRYTPSNGTLTLLVKVVDKKSEDIGFRRDPKEFTQEGKNKNKVIKRIIPSESRLKRLIEVQVVDTATKNVLLGPSYLLGTCDFDHEDYSPDRNINIFSLGQLSDIDTTYDVVDIPLSRDIAKKVAFFLQNNFDVIVQDKTMS